jgi:hypothetical protein
MRGRCEASASFRIGLNLATGSKEIAGE